jgi:flagellar basal body-associated protein FliL
LKRGLKYEESVQNNESKAKMIGTIIIIILLVALIPVSIIMTGLIFSGLLGRTIQKDVDSENEGTELLELSKKDFLP